MTQGSHRSRHRLGSYGDYDWSVYVPASRHIIRPIECHFCNEPVTWHLGVQFIQNNRNIAKTDSHQITIPRHRRRKLTDLMALYKSDYYYYASCALGPDQQSNPRPLDHKSGIRPVASPDHPIFVELCVNLHKYWCNFQCM